VNFVSKHRSSSIWTLSEWKKYTQEFVVIGGWLLAKNKISSNDHATYFWKGIVRTLHNKIETQLLAPTLLRDMTTPFTFDEVTQAAEKIVQWDHFDTDLVYSDTEGSDSDQSDSSTDTDSDSELSSEEKYKKQAKSSKRAKYKTHLPTRKTAICKTCFEDYNSDDKETPISKTRKAVHQQRASKQSLHKEVENLIQQLVRMKIGDANYSTPYYKAITLDPAVKDIIESPLERNRKEYAMGLRDTRFPSARFTQRDRKTSNIARGINNNSNYSNMPNRSSSAPNYQSNPYPKRTTCYGCGEENHELATYPKIEELLTRGELIRM
jgi:hypothetical protein